MDRVEINLEGNIIKDSIINGVNDGTVISNYNCGSIKKEFPYYEELASLLEDLEYAERKVGNEREVLEAIYSLEKAIKEGNKTSIVDVAKKFAKNFTGAVFTRAASGALVGAIKAWAQM